MTSAKLFYFLLDNRYAYYYLPINKSLRGRARRPYTWSRVPVWFLNITINAEGPLMEKTANKPEQKEIIHLAGELCYDVCMEVRKATASQMAAIVKSLPNSAVPGKFVGLD